MNAKTNNNLILSLIKDDLINSKLVNGLNDLGLDAGHYYLNLSDTVFELMGFEDTEENEAIYSYYLALTKKAKYVDISESHKPLEKLALEIYYELAVKKQGL